MAQPAQLLSILMPLQQSYSMRSLDETYNEHDSIWSERTVGVENVFYRYDKTKIRVISGDVQEGFWSLDGFQLVKAPSCCGSAIPTERIDLSGKIASVQLQDAKQSCPAGSIVGAGMGALAGLRYYGLVGALGGAFAGHFICGGSTEIHVNVEFVDGRKFLAVMSPGMFRRFTGIANRG